MKRFRWKFYVLPAVLGFELGFIAWSWWVKGPLVLAISLLNVYWFDREER